MAQGETLVICTQCGSQSRIPVIALKRNNYHCSRCGNRIPLANVNLPVENPNQRAFRSKSKNRVQKRKRH
jgi:hypothetical protein